MNLQYNSKSLVNFNVFLTVYTVTFLSYQGLMEVSLV